MSEDDSRNEAVCTACREVAGALHDAALFALAEIAAASALRVPWQGIRCETRGKRRHSTARQTAFYLARRVGDLDFMVISRLSGRERTTVRHGFDSIARARGRSGLDWRLAVLEQAVASGLTSVFDNLAD